MRKLLESFCYLVRTKIEVLQEQSYENTQDDDAVEEHYWLGRIDGFEDAVNVMFDSVNEAIQELEGEQ